MFKPAPTPARSFIEAQFPVSKLSKESYKERKANYSQTLTGLGKWWGRKPLILARATILGLLLPATDNPKLDREIFLKLLTMDEDGLWRRKTKSIPLRVVYARLTTAERERFFKPDSPASRPQFKKSVKREQRLEAQRLVFSKMSYDEKLEFCDRPEQIDGPSEKAWAEINSHLGTTAASLPDLIRQLGERRFGHTPRVGDAFCGGGSVPFEAARIGCEAYGSDLNPVAALLTWAALNIVGGGEEVAQQVREAQADVYGAVNRQIIEWGIEHNEDGHRADAYLYCNEVVCPECGWRVPLAPSWVIGEKTRCVARLQPDEANKRFEILIESGVSEAEMIAAKNAGTAKDSSLICPNPNCRQSTPITTLRGDRRTEDGAQYGLRLWENDDLAPRPDDVFQERLYCIRWVETYRDEEGREQTFRYYRAPDNADLSREARALELLRERFCDWQGKGYLPSRRIESGDKTEEPIRTRGWTYWHHLFNPRQLLTLGCFFEKLMALAASDPIKLAASTLGAGRCCDYNATLSRWHPHGANEKSEQVFSNQALNTLVNYSARSVISLHNAFFIDCPAFLVATPHKSEPADARRITASRDIWITDPPYADAINYHELSEFFLAWYEKSLRQLFPDWYTDSKRALAIIGSEEGFRRSMVDCYRNLAEHMPANGLQVVMFTHQDAGVWADLALILWASGLRVTAAWCIATETDSALKEGNYVQGTVLLVLRKQTSDATAFLDDVYPQVENEVKAQMAAMLALEDLEDPNFGDTDYQLAAYAAALRVLTQYRRIEEIDVAYELARTRRRGEESPLEKLIVEAVKIACDYLVPHGFDTFVWKTLKPEERFYLKGLDIESHGEHRAGAYQELARGFGLRDYRQLLSSGKANQTRLKTPAEFGSRMLGDAGFGASLVRQALFAIHETCRTEEVSQGLNWLKNELLNYWQLRRSLLEVLRYLATMEHKLPHWKREAAAARLLAGAVENDSV